MRWLKPDVVDFAVPAPGKAARAVFRWKRSTTYLKDARLIPRDDKAKKGWWNVWSGHKIIKAASLNAEKAVFPVVPAGEYRLGLDFLASKLRRRMILPQVHRFSPGEDLELDIDLPRVEKLVVLVVNWHAIPALLRPRSLQIRGPSEDINEGRAEVLDVRERSPEIRFSSPIMPEDVRSQGIVRPDGRTIAVEFPFEKLQTVEIMMRPVMNGFPFVCRAIPRANNEVQSVDMATLGYGASHGKAVKLAVPRGSHSVFNIWERFIVGRLLYNVFRGQVRVDDAGLTWVIGAEGREVDIRVPKEWGRVHLVVTPETSATKTQGKFTTGGLRVEDVIRTWIPAGPALLSIRSSAQEGRGIVKRVRLEAGQTEVEFP